MKLSLVQLLLAKIRGMRGNRRKSGLISPKELNDLEVDEAMYYFTVDEKLFDVQNALMLLIHYRYVRFHEMRR